jgi:hypothetical protein
MRRFNLPRSVAPLAAGLLLGCDGGRAADRTETPAIDAGRIADAAAPGASAPDAGAHCACEADEDCHACYENIGRCCYDDPTMLGNLEAVVANCQALPGCRACCNECAARSCDALKANGECPNL